jgi:hypothetical protein
MTLNMEKNMGGNKALIIIIFVIVGAIIGPLIGSQAYDRPYYEWWVFGGVVIGAIIGAVVALASKGNNNERSVTGITKKCPFCANDIKLEAIICQYCGKELNNEFVSTHRVNLQTKADGMSLRETPNPNVEPFRKIPNGTEIQYLSTGDKVKLNEINGFWFHIRTKENICGWCFSGSLEKI